MWRSITNLNSALSCFIDINGVELHSFNDPLRKPILFGLKKMDFIFSDCCHWNVQDISQPQNNVNQETGTFSYAREALTQVKENQPLPDENDFIEFWNRNCQNYYEHSESKQSSCLGNNSVERNDFGELDEILNHVPRLPSYLQGTEGKKMNFIMIATTLDKKTITENLEKTLDKTKFQALPLSFEVQTMEHIFDGK